MLLMLNMIPNSFIIRILFISSACFSLFYFFLACCEIVKIIWNKFNPDKNWGTKNRHNPVDNKHIPIKLLLFSILYFIVVLCLVLIFPIFHI